MQDTIAEIINIPRIAGYNSWAYKYPYFRWFNKIRTTKLRVGPRPTFFKKIIHKTLTNYIFLPLFLLLLHPIVYTNWLLWVLCCQWGEALPLTAITSQYSLQSRSMYKFRSIMPSNFTNIFIRLRFTENLF